MSNFSKENYAKCLASERCTKIEQEWEKYKNSQRMTRGDKIRAMSDAALADFLEGECNMMPGTALQWLTQTAD